MSQDIVTWTINRVPSYEILSLSTDFTNNYQDNSLDIPYENDFHIPNDRYFNMTNSVDINNPITHNNINFRFNNNDMDNADFIAFTNDSSVNQAEIEFVHESFDLEADNKLCCICLESRETEEICKFNCQHTTCVSCINELIHKNSNTRIPCPLCRTTIKKIYQHPK